MPTYKITDPNSGRTMRVTGDSPPSETELTELFGGESNKIPRSQGNMPDWMNKIPSYNVGVDLDKAAMNVVPNLVGTVGGIAKNVIEHPLESAKNIVLAPGALPVGAAEKVIQTYGGETGKKFLDWFGRGALDQFWQPFENQLKEKYGSKEAFKKTIEERPAEAMMDVSTALGIGGKALKKLDVPAVPQARAPMNRMDLKGINQENAKSLLMPESVAPLTRIGNAMEQLGGQINPVSMASRAVAPIARATKNTPISPERVYGSAMKMPLSQKWVKTLPGQEISQRQRAIQSGIESRVFRTEYGIAKTAQLEKQARQAVDDVIKIGSEKGEIVRTEDIIKNGLGKAYDRASKSSDPAGAKKIVDDVAVKFRAHGETVSLSDLNKIKRQLYDEVKWGGAEQTALVGQLTSMGKKGMANAAKEYMENLHPELKGLNQKDAAYINLKEAIERAVARDQNKDIVGLAAKAISVRSIPMAILEHTLGHPHVKAVYTFAVNKARKAKGLPPLPSNIIYQANQVTEGQNESQQQ